MTVKPQHSPLVRRLRLWAWDATWAPFAFVALSILTSIASCSSLNREGPLVTCSDLDGGTTNACKDGIIASCTNGSMVTYEVCTEGEAPEDICEQSWQMPGHYTCENESARSSGSAAASSGGTTSSSGGSTSGGSPNNSGGSPNNSGEVATCAAGEHRCRDGSCITPNKVCDTKDDCFDGTDENSTACSSRTSVSCSITQSCPLVTGLSNVTWFDYDRGGEAPGTDTSLEPNAIGANSFGCYTGHKICWGAVATSTTTTSTTPMCWGVCDCSHGNAACQHPIANPDPQFCWTCAANADCDGVLSCR